MKEFISLSEKNPEAAKMWDDEKNNALNLPPPHLISAGSNKRAYFICSNNKEHRFDSKITDMTKRDGSCKECPICSNRAIVTNNGIIIRTPQYSETLAEVCPESVEMWDNEHNEETPYTLSPKSNYEAHFICSNNHKFTKRVADFCESPYCPECKKNDICLFTKKPKLLVFFSKANNCNPSDISRYSNKEYEWVCPKCHKTWIESAKNAKTKCPHCKYTNTPTTYGIGEVSGFSIAHDNLRVYYSSKNIVPFDNVTETGNPKLWWKCEKNHEFQYNLDNFTRKRKFACPVCAGRLAIEGETDLLSQYPELAKQYSEKNAKPSNKVSVYNRNSETLWKCVCGQEFRAPVKSRIAGAKNCPNCRGRAKNTNNENESADDIPSWH